MKLLPALLLLLVPGLASAQTAHSDLATQRARELHRGVNASMWFAQAHDYSVGRLRSYTTADDIRLMRTMGFDHVRLSIDGDELLRDAPPGGLNAAFVGELDAAVRSMLENKLRVIIDVHPTDAFKHTLASQDAAVDRFCALWSALAAHFAQSDPDRVFFEVLNEPEFQDEQQWRAVEGRTIAAIRHSAPQHTILATGRRYSGLTDLLTFAPFDDTNIIYTFHDYDPFYFTHQGATWANSQVRPLRRIPYPSSPENIAPLLSEEEQLVDQHWLNTYGLDRWDATRIRSEVSFAAKWGALHHVPVYCGEFGVYKAYSDPAMRAVWLHDMRTALEAEGIGWAVWDYQGTFAVVTKSDGKASPDPPIAAALGLEPQ